jgi:flagellar hook assembly protein FlgD
VQPGEQYGYYISAVLASGEEVTSNTVNVRVPTGSFALHQNAPNPFRSRTAISLELPEPAHASLSIYDPQGRLVRQLFNGDLPGGLRHMEWDGRDGNGAPVSSGVYFYALRAGLHHATKKLILLH